MAWVMQDNPDTGRKQRLYPDNMRANQGAAREAVAPPPPSAGIHANSPSLNSYQQRASINPPPGPQAPTNMSEMLQRPAVGGGGGISSIPPNKIGGPGAGLPGQLLSEANANRPRIAGNALAVAPEAYNTYRDIAHGGLSPSQQGLRLAEGAIRVGGALAGGAAGAALGPVGALAGGSLGYALPDLVARGYKNVTGNELTLPSSIASRNMTPPDATVSTANTPITARATNPTPAPVNTNLTPPTTEGWVPGKLLSQIQAQQAKYDTNAVAAALAGNRGASPLDSNPAAVDTAYKAGVANRAPRTVEYKQPTQEEKVNKNEAWANQILKDPYFARYQPQTVDAAKTFLQSARAFRADQTERAKVQADFDLRRSNVDATNQERAYQHERDAVGDKAAAAKAQRDEIRYQAEHADDVLKAQQAAHNDNLNQAKAYLTKDDEKGNKLGIIDALLGAHSSSFVRKGLSDDKGRMSPEAMRTVMPQLLQAISAGKSAESAWYKSNDPAAELQAASGLLGQWLASLPDVPQTH